MNAMDAKGGFPLAIDPPEGQVVPIDSSLVGKAIEASRKSPRGRVILPFHKSYRDPLQRMLNVLQPGSYIQPHRHKSPPKAESIVVLKGSICYVTFSDGGGVEAHFTLMAGSAAFGMDTPPGVYHTFFALMEDTGLFEVKPGPYDPDTDKDFARWAPPEGSPEAGTYLNSLCGLTGAVVMCGKGPPA